MFTYSVHHADDAALSSSGAGGLGEHGRAAQRLERQAAARKVLLAHRIGQAIFDDMLHLDPADLHPADLHPGVGNAAEKAAVGEVSLQFGVSRTMAGRWMELGSMLADLPRIRIAFLTGDYTLNRVTILAHALERLDPHLRETAQDTAISLAGRPVTDTVLRDLLDELVITVDPDQATADREDYADRYLDLTITNDGQGHSAIEATVPAEHGVHLRTRIDTLIEQRLCPDDPRTIGHRRVDALADIHALPGAHLQCQCGLPTCPKRRPGETPPATTAQPDTTGTPTTRQPAPTLVLERRPDTIARLRGHGAIDPAHADHIAAMPGVTVIAAPGPATSGPLTPGLVTPGAGALSATTPAAVPIDPTGHGGYHHSPPGALTYTPTTALRAQILATDRYCRYPFCGMPADRCELDHLVTFDHTNPTAGGWTLPANIAPLCTPDHHRKHLRRWIPHMNTDRTITWHNPETGQSLTTYP
ncbi:HNH endonuclease signature motif containing protein [Gordonia soli]|uniref:DUF222 domain-containing protein n=1 Tax=Gordonia soli NBRC 108243 TaxID=1223545 RepID=M0QQ00_9ACTN|nr:HNH endonuclease signature motif containing protein [Gordonia soli]GAC70658.1 hypothetical protein GS4_38_00640 [Gordonia soli NBRC 108243]